VIFFDRFLSEKCSCIIQHILYTKYGLKLQKNMTILANKIKDIEAKASTVLDAVYTSALEISLPISLEKILNHYGLIIKSGKFKDSNISGAYNKNEKIIFLGEQKSVNEKALTVAHEIGDFILHAEKATDIFYQTEIINLENIDDEIEQEANLFAVCLLIPEREIKEYYTTMKDLNSLSAVFGVPPTAVNYRLNNLALLS
jgi:Zn-dependent peptidase ImmA (M78 family)